MPVKRSATADAVVPRRAQAVPVTDDSRIEPDMRRRVDRALVRQDYGSLRDELYRVGIVSAKETLPRAWGHGLFRDYQQLFAEASNRPDGLIGRGRNRYYFQVHPERLSGLLPLLTNPFLDGLSTEVLGPDYQIVEVAFDVPLPGALHQRWHRDFPMPEVTRRYGRINALAFNTSAVDVTPIRGPFEIAMGTHFDDDAAFEYQMFPPLTDDYAPRATKRFAKLGDISARTPLAIHRGTPNRSSVHRPVLVLGAITGEADSELRPVFSRRFFTDLPEEVRRHLRHAELVDDLTPLKQTHDIEGLMMGDG